MRRRQCYIIAGVTGVGLALALVLHSRATQQPRWQGKRVSEWFAEFRKARINHRRPVQFPANIRLPGLPGSNSGAPLVAYYEDTDGLMRDPVADAFRAMGTNAVPFLLGQLRRKDSSWGTNYSKFYFKLPMLLQKVAPSPPAPRDMVRSDAALALAAIGTNATSAVPAVIEIFATEPRMRKFYLNESLRRLPPGAFDTALENFCRQGDLMEAVNTVQHFQLMTLAAARTLTNAILSTNSTARTKALQEARAFRGYASLIVPALTIVLERGDNTIRQTAAWDLQSFGPEAAPALSALVKALQSNDEELRYQAARAIENLGTNALPALPALTAVTNDANVMLQRVATRTLQDLGKNP